MSSAGHVLDMVNRMKQNAALKKGRREKNKWRSVSQKGASHRKTELSVPKHTREEIDAAMEHVRQDAQKQHKKMQVLYGIVGLLSLALLVLAFVFL